MRHRLINLNNTISTEIGQLSKCMVDSESQAYQGWSDQLQMSKGMFVWEWLRAEDISINSGLSLLPTQTVTCRNIYTPRVYTLVSGHACTSLSCQQGAHLLARCWFLMTFSKKKKKSGLPEKWLILKLGQKMYKMNLKYLIEPESMDRLLSPSK